MASSIYSKDVFSTKSLGKELATALEEDRIYKITDEMKKKAIRTAANYDEFRNLVACADLKPMSQEEIQQGFGTLNGNTRKGINNQKSYTKIDSSKREFKSKQPTSPATSSADFGRTWNRYTKTTQEKFSKIFTTEMDSSLILDVLHVLSSEWNDILSSSPEETSSSISSLAAYILVMSNAITQTGRFSLNVAFWSKSEKKLVLELFSSLEEYINKLTIEATSSEHKIFSDIKVIKKKFE